jgi:hypothetical protein
MFYSCTCIVSIVLISTYIVLMVATFQEIWPLGKESGKKNFSIRDFMGIQKVISLK